MTSTTAALLTAARRFDPGWTLTLESKDHRGHNYVAGRLNKTFGVNDTRGRVVGGEAVLYTQYRMVPNPELIENGGTKDFGMTMVATDEVVGYEVRIFSTRNGYHFGAIPRRARGSVLTSLAGAQHYAEQKLDLKRRQTLRAAAKTGGTYMTDGERRRLTPPSIPCAYCGRPVGKDQEAIYVGYEKDALCRKCQENIHNRHED